MRHKGKNRMILDYSEYVTERRSNGIVNFVRVDNGTALFNHDSVCPFCQKRITSTVYGKTKRSYPEWLFGSFDESEWVVQCPTCGWWEYKYSNQSDAIIDGIHRCVSMSRDCGERRRLDRLPLLPLGWEK